MYTDFTLRITKQIFKGNVDMIKDLLDVGFLLPEHTFHGKNNTQISILQYVAETNPPCATAMIDMLLSHGYKVDDGIWRTPLEHAIIYGHFNIAAYLQSKGGTYTIENVSPEDIKALDMACLASSVVQASA